MRSLDKKLSIITVNYNAGDYLINCLGGVAKAAKKVALDMYVVDNASIDDSIQRAKRLFPEVSFILNRENLGFGAANNQALKLVKTKYVLLLNPDIKLEPGTLEYLLAFMEKNPRVGAATCKAIHADGSLDWAYHRGFPTPLASVLYFLGWDKLYHLTDRDINVSHEVDAISGSFFFTKKEVLDEVGIFDEDYWMYGEDLDLCFRIKESGYKIMYLPDVFVTHLKGISSGIKKHSQQISSATLVSREKAFNSFYETMKIFYKKHLEKKYPFFINWLIYFGIDIKWFLAKRNMKV